MRNSENSTTAVFYENGLNNRSITASHFRAISPADCGTCKNFTATYVDGSLHFSH